MSATEPPQSSQDLLRSRLESLRGRFRVRAEDDLGAMTDALVSGERDVLRERAHRLAGVAATFGYPAVGKAAKKLDDLVSEGALAEETDAAAARLFYLLGRLASSPP